MNKNKEYLKGCKLQQINTKKKEIYVYCSTNGIVWKSQISAAWGKRLPGYSVKFINVNNGKKF